MAKRGRPRKFAARHPGGQIKRHPMPDRTEATPELMAHRIALVGGDGKSANAGWTIGILYERGLLADRFDRDAADRRKDAGERLVRIMARYERVLCLPRRPKAANMARTDGSVDNEDDGDEYRLAMRDYRRCRDALSARGWQVQAATLRAAKDEDGWRPDLVAEGLDAIAAATGRKSQRAA